MATRRLILSNRTQVIASLAVLAGLCALAVAANWLKLLTLWGDAGIGLVEAQRVAQGELPYRDFALRYPPLSTLLLGYSFRLFGATFVTAQVFYNVVSAAIILLMWLVARRVLPPLTALAVAAVLAVQGANQYVFFTLSVFSHAQLTGLIGHLLLLLGALGYAQTGRWTGPRLLALAAGAAISLLSKLEFGAAVLGCLAALALVDWRLRSGAAASRPWLGRTAGLAALALAPGLGVLAGFGQAAGWDNLLTGLGGFGLAGTACPWWPSGIGLLGGAMALGLALPFTALVSLPHAPALWSRWRGRYLSLWGLAALGLAGYAAYYYYYFFIFTQEGRGDPLLYHIAEITRLNTLLLPVLWVALPVWLVQTWRLLRPVRAGAAHPPPTRDTAVWYVLLTVGLAAGARALFGAHTYNHTSATQAAHPALLLVGVYFLSRAQQRWSAAGAEARGSARPWLPSSRAWWPALVLAAYGSLHLLGLVLEVSSGGQRYTPLATAAGAVRLFDTSAAPLYEYIVTHTAPDDYVLSLAYGGGLNFASQRRVPTFSTQFIHVAPPSRFLQMDVDRLQRHPPALVIADDNPTLGAGYGWWPPDKTYGSYLVRCAFPAILWYASKPAYPFETPVPVAEYVRAHYRPVAEVAGKVLYAPAP